MISKVLKWVDDKAVHIACGALIVIIVVLGVQIHKLEERVAEQEITIVEQTKILAELQKVGG